MSKHLERNIKSSCSINIQKTTSLNKIMKAILKTAVLFSIAAGISISSKAAPAPQTADSIVFTEVSDTVLTVQVNDDPIVTETTLTPDAWQFSMPYITQNGSPYPFVSDNWAEPGYPTDGSTEVNIVWYNWNDTPGLVEVHSDVSGIANQIPADGATLQPDPSYQGFNATRTFNDLGDSAGSVPDNATTGILLLFPSIALLGWHRRQALMA